MSMTKWPISFMRPFVERYPHLAVTYRRIRDQMSFAEEPIQTPWGFRLAGNSAMANGSYEPTETGLIRDILRQVDLLVNVGANIGYYCCHALSMGKPVIAFEPVERNLRYLCKNVKLNGWSGVEIYPIALSNSVGVLDLYGSGTGASIVKGWADIPESYVNLVPSSTMDLVLGERLKGKKTLVLVDIEGAEKWMLEGATSILVNNPKPIWVVEITATDNQPRGTTVNPNLESTFEIFFKHGYQSFCFNHSMHPVTVTDIKSAARGDARLSTYNFMFCESALK